MSKKIVITGATGFIGQNLSRKLINNRNEIIVFTRNVEKGKAKVPGASKYVEWDYHKPENWQNHLNGVDAVIHLAGANLNGKRWTDEYKRTILESRKISTRNLVDSFNNIEEKPKAFICSSGVDIYGDSGDKELLENSEKGDQYISKVCKVWEEEVLRAEKFNVRNISIRTAIVLSIQEGALQKFLLPFKFFVGGPLGTGKQWFPWIHIEDIINIYIFALNNELSGAVNAAAPDYVRMNEFANSLGKVLHRPSFFKVPGPILKIVLGELANPLLSSKKVIPQKLKDNDFKFNYPELIPALKDLIENDK